MIASSPCSNNIIYVRITRDFYVNDLVKSQFLEVLFKMQYMLIAISYESAVDTKLMEPGDR